MSLAPRLRVRVRLRPRRSWDDEDGECPREAAIIGASRGWPGSTCARHDDTAGRASARRGTQRGGRHRPPPWLLDEDACQRVALAYYDYNRDPHVSEAIDFTAACVQEARRLVGKKSE